VGGIVIDRFDHPVISVRDPDGNLIEVSNDLSAPV
jgi:hypothetical protein